MRLAFSFCRLRRLRFLSARFQIFSAAFSLSFGKHLVLSVLTFLGLSLPLPFALAYAVLMPAKYVRIRVSSAPFLNPAASRTADRFLALRHVSLPPKKKPEPYPQLSIEEQEKKIRSKRKQREFYLKPRRKVSLPALAVQCWRLWPRRKCRFWPSLKCSFWPLKKMPLARSRHSPCDFALSEVGTPREAEIV
jgi:hypothetical protein